MAAPELSMSRTFHIRYSAECPFDDDCVVSLLAHPGGYCPDRSLGQPCAIVEGRIRRTSLYALQSGSTWVRTEIRRATRQTRQRDRAWLNDMAKTFNTGGLDDLGDDPPPARHRRNALYWSL